MLEDILSGLYIPDPADSFEGELDAERVGNGSEREDEEGGAERLGAGDVDAAVLTAGGNLLFSTNGNLTVGGLAVTDEDVIEFTGTFGSSTSGSFSMRQDLSTLGIAANEDIGSLFLFE